MNEEEILPTKLLPHPLSLCSLYQKRGTYPFSVDSILYQFQTKNEKKTTNRDKKRTKDFVVNTICAIDLFFVIIIYCE